jgi:hypothetical protein
MPTFGFRRNTGPQPARGVQTIRKGIGYLQVGDFDSALREFRSVAASRHPSTTRLVKSVANGYAYHTERFRKESKKVRFGNAHLMELVPGNNGDAWSDVDIAMVLVTPNNAFTTKFLARFLGRGEEAVRFQRRYAFEQPLPSWVSETGERYTRFTQTQRVAQRLGIV